jgi:periplasmic divalent cation tolerance protein
MVSQFLQVMTTTDKKEDAGAIARSLVEKRLAGCVQVLGPITSTYRWEGEIETAEEWLCIAKTRAELYDQVEVAIRGLHPYDVPEILAVPVSQGNPAYLQWLEDETT